MKKNSNRKHDKDAGKLVDAILLGKNVDASERLEKILKEKTAKRLKDVLDSVKQ